MSLQHLQILSMTHEAVLLMWGPSMFLSLPSTCVIPIPKLIPLPLGPVLGTIQSRPPACRALTLTVSVTHTR